MSTSIVQADANGEIVYCGDGLSFWGGVDPASGRVIDVYHPLKGQSLAGKIMLMPTSRGSCSGSGVLLELALNGRAPAALIFSETEEILTLGAIIAGRLFDKPVAVARLSHRDFDLLSRASEASITGTRLEADGLDCDLQPISKSDIALTETDLAALEGGPDDPTSLAMDVICTMAVAQGVERLTSVSRGHIDGCIFAHNANLIFAERMAHMGAKVRIPTTINAISIDRESGHLDGTPDDFAQSARRLADAYVTMGAYPTFTCAPYLLDDIPALGEAIGWSESNAVIYANSVLGAQTTKLPDYLDLFVAMTGRAPDSGVYLAQNRRPACIIECAAPKEHDDTLWPLIGWLAGRLAKDQVPLLKGLDHLSPDQDDLRALCAAFGTTAASPMLHVHGVTPEAGLAPLPWANTHFVSLADIANSWHRFNSGPQSVDLVAIGSPHASLQEVALFAELMGCRQRHPDTHVILTVGRNVLEQAREAGWVVRLEAAGARVISDLCWCSITEPVFPPEARNLMTNSGKYAHYAPGLSGRTVRFGGLRDCAEAAVTGRAPTSPPKWMQHA